MYILKRPLTNDARWVLSCWATGRDLRLARRAWALTAILEGQRLSTVAEAAGQTEDRLVKWIDSLRDFGVQGVLDAPRCGRPKMASTPTLNHFELYRQGMVTMEQLADSFGVSADTIWRTARRNDVRLQRRRSRNVRIICPDALDDGSRLTALLAGSGVCAAAFSTQHQGEETPVGIWQHVHSGQLRAFMLQVRSTGRVQPGDLLSCALRGHISEPGISKARTETEKVTAWLRRLADSAACQKVELEFYGDPNAEKYKGLLKMARAVGLFQGDGGYCKSIIFGASTEIGPRVLEAVGGQTSLYKASESQCSFAWA